MATWYFENYIDWIDCESNIHTLQGLVINDNPIEYIPTNVRRLLNRQTRAQGGYNDAQSVHNSTINASIMHILSILLLIPTVFSLLFSPILL